MDRDLQFAVVKAHHGPLFYILIVLIVLAVIVAVLRLLYCRKLKKAVAAGTMTEEEAATLRKQGLRMWLGEERAKLQAKHAASKEAKEAKRAAAAEAKAAAEAQAAARRGKSGGNCAGRQRRGSASSGRAGRSGSGNRGRAGSGPLKAAPSRRKPRRRKRTRTTPTRRSIPDANHPLPHKLRKSPIGLQSGIFVRTRRQNRPRHTGRGGRQISDRVSLCALPLDALRVSSSTMPAALSSSRMRSASAQFLALRAA